MRGEKVVLTAEDGIVDGGFGQKVASALGESPVKVVNLGLPKRFLNRYNAADVLNELGLTPDKIAEKVISLL